MNKPYTPKERARHSGTIAWFCVLASFLSLVSILFFEESYILSLFIFGSITSAVIAVFFGVRGLLITPSPRSLWATIFGALILLAYGVLLYLMRDFCVVC